MTTAPSSFMASSEVGEGIAALATTPHFAHDQECFAARQSGLYRSNDGGVSWHSMYNSLMLDQALSTTAVAISPDWESDHRVFAGVPGGILRSTNGGETWLAAILPSPPPVISTLVVSPNFMEDGILFAGTMEDGIFRSADRGSSWAAWNFGLLDLSVLSMAISPDFAQDETVFVGTETGLFRSMNGGLAWCEVHFPTEFAPVLYVALSPNYAHDGILFVGTEYSGLFYSSDGGGTWQRLAADLITEAVNSILLSPHFATQPEVLVLTSDALLFSQDAGLSWSDWKPSLSFVHEAMSMVVLNGIGPDATLLIGLADGNVLRVS